MTSECNSNRTRPAGVHDERANRTSNIPFHRLSGPRAEWRTVFQQVSFFVMSTLTGKHNRTSSVIYTLSPEYLYRSFVMLSLTINQSTRRCSSCSRWWDASLSLFCSLSLAEKPERWPNWGGQINLVICSQKEHFFLFFFLHDASTNLCRPAVSSIFGRQAGSSERVILCEWCSNRWHISVYFCRASRAERWNQNTHIPARSHVMLWLRVCALVWFPCKLISDEIEIACLILLSGPEVSSWRTEERWICTGLLKFAAT